MSMTKEKQVTPLIHLKIKSNTQRYERELVAQLYLTLALPMDCNPPCSSVHALLQGLLPTQGSNLGLLRLLHCQADSVRLHHHLGSSAVLFS